MNDFACEVDAATGLRSAQFEVVESGRRPRNSNAVHCVLGQHLIIDPDKLGGYCLTTLPRRVDDLVVVAGAVAFADKITPRRVAQSWGRKLSVLVPVLDLDFWTQRKVQKALTDSLTLLTGDIWHFEFSQRHTPLTPGRQAVLPFGNSPALVMPFSDGLDSLAVARLTAAASGDAGLILVTTGKLSDPDADWRTRHLNKKYHRVSVPFRLPRRGSKVRFREPSSRTRAFVFGAMAGVAASLLRAERIVVAESGQGSLGPWLTPTGNEAPDVRMHPAYTKSLGLLLSQVFNHRVQFDHPRLWSTKGETLTELSDAGLAQDWEKTRSCARDQRDLRSPGPRIQCGVCANCLLRRQSLAASGLRSSSDRYFWSDLSAPTLQAAADGGSRATLNDERHARCGVLALAELAALGRSQQKCAPLGWAAEELAVVLGEPSAIVARRIQRLVLAHQSEWDSFVGSLGPSSFVSRWVRHLQC